MLRGVKNEKVKAVLAGPKREWTEFDPKGRQSRAYTVQASRSDHTTIESATHLAAAPMVCRLIYQTIATLHVIELLIGQNLIEPPNEIFGRQAVLGNTMFRQNTEAYLASADTAVPDVPYGSSRTSVPNGSASNFDRQRNLLRQTVLRPTAGRSLRSTDMMGVIVMNGTMAWITANDKPDRD